MAPLPHNNTALMYFDYVTGNAVTSQQHTMQMRLSSSTTTLVEEAHIQMLALLTAIGAANFWSGWRILQTRLQAQGANFSTPVSSPELAPLLAFAGTETGGYQPRYEAIETTFQGRSPTAGRRVDVSIYGLVPVTPIPNTFRVAVDFSNGGNWVADALAVLNAAPSLGTFLAIDGTAPLWYGYANVNYNSYWEQELRS